MCISQQQETCAKPTSFGKFAPITKSKRVTRLQSNSLIKTKHEEVLLRTQPALGLGSSVC